MRRKVWWLSALLLLGTNSIHAQKVTQYAASFRGSDAVHLLADDSMYLYVVVWLKWVSKGSTGVAQFRIEAYPQQGSKTVAITTAEQKEQYINRITGCSLGLSLTGGDQFSFGDVSLRIVNIHENSSHSTSLSGSGSIPMTAPRYREFVQQGSWVLTWSCPSAFR